LDGKVKDGRDTAYGKKIGKGEEGDLRGRSHLACSVKRASILKTLPTDQNKKDQTREKDERVQYQSKSPRKFVQDEINAQVSPKEKSVSYGRGYGYKQCKTEHF
jgi:hypothetical protein